MFDTAVGRRIRNLREEQKMSREELASKAEITTKFLYEVENGKKGLSANSLYKIATALSSSCDYILLGKKGAYDQRNTVEGLYLDLLKDMDEKQRTVIIKILGILIDLSGENGKLEL